MRLVRGVVMWFDCDDKNIHSCSDCYYGDKDVFCQRCKSCLDLYVDCGKKYQLWQKNERGKFNDSNQSKQ